jgi:type II secretory pathway pseudopilin PulG
MTWFGEAILIALVSILGTVGGWLFGRRKNKAEASLLEVKAITAIREFYETALKDTKNQLQYYIQ